MRHEWETKDGEDILKLAIEDEGMFYRYPDDTRWRPTGGHPRAYRHEIFRLAEENVSLKATVDPLVTGIAALEAQLAEVREEALRLERENRDLKEALPVFTANNPADQEKARILTEIFKVAAMHGDPVASLLQRISDLEAENTALADECVKLARERDSLEAEHADIVELCDGLTRELDSWKAEVERLKGEAESLRDANRLLARGSMHAALARSAEVSMAEVMRSDGGRRQLALEAEVERLRAERTTFRERFLQDASEIAFDDWRDAADVRKMIDAILPEEGP